MARKVPDKTPEELARENAVREQGYATFQQLIDQQEGILNKYYVGAPVIKEPNRGLTFREFLPISAAEYKSLSKEDKDRLNYWFNEWTKPVSSYGAKENTSAQRVFFGIVTEKIGLERADFNWTKFRRRYFKKNPDRYSAFKEHQKSRKGKKK